MADKELNNEIENLTSDMRSVIFTHGSSFNTLLWDEVQIAINNHKKALDHRQPDTELVEANKNLRIALIQHRADLHGASGRPCGTCQQSAEALGIKVPDMCARPHLDKAALTKYKENNNGTKEIK